MYLCNASNRPVVVLEKKEADVKLSVLNGEWKIGWNGNSNGYYLAGIFNGGEGPTFPSTRAAGKEAFRTLLSSARISPHCVTVPLDILSTFSLPFEICVPASSASCHIICLLSIAAFE